MESNKAKTIKFILNGCDISFIATAPADMTVEQLVKQGSRIKPDWCACGVCAYEMEYDCDIDPEIVFDYNDVRKTNDDVSCSIKDN